MLTDGEKDEIINDIDDGITDGKVGELIDSDCTNVGTGVRKSLVGCNDEIIFVFSVDIMKEGWF